ncbi:MINPP1 [Mytilus coruscus]|uniref:Multiple inositol polyphosphate phosphatase 1 n=1 Tax=Mytilus coruscus TaxID=42192 RepID=A0A6J8B2W3_MYTCO|nr:MINPP1 [Mytilus coruscus]
MAYFLLPVTMAILYIAQTCNADMLTGQGNNLFGHKCSYFWRFPNTTIKTNYLMQFVQMDGNICNAMQFNYISRHGARMPETDDYASFGQLKTKIIEHSSNLLRYPFIQRWQNYRQSTHAHVEDLGRWELHYLGNFFGSGLYNLFHGNISPATMKLTATERQRTQTSSIEFYKALSKRVTGKALNDIHPVVNNTMLRYWDNCPNYDLTILKNKTQMQQQYAFQNSSYFQNVIKSVTKKLEMNVSLTPDDIKAMFMICATDLAVRNNTDWCSLQTETEREIINYEGDLEDYYSLLYGHSLIKEMTCPLWQDLFSSMDDAISKHKSGEPYVLGNFRFGHSDTIDTFYSALGLYRDSQPLRADNFDTMKNRKFYESKVTPFSANIAFILYKCGGSGAENYLLKMMVNNQPVTIPGCDSDFCPYLKVRGIYRSYIENCKWRELCSVKTISQIVG